MIRIFWIFLNLQLPSHLVVEAKRIVEAEAGNVQIKTQVHLREDLEAGNVQTATQAHLRETHVNVSSAQWQLGPNKTPYTEQFKVKEKGGIFTADYKFELEEYEDPKTGKELKDNIDKKVMYIDAHFFTLHDRATVKGGIKGFHDVELHKPHITGLNLHYTWRVSGRKDGERRILFTIQKQIFATHCKYYFWFLGKCKEVIRIYQGHVGDGKLVYYGVGDDELDEPDFKFYHSEAEFNSNKKNYAGKIDHKKTSSWLQEDKYKVKVKSGEDAALILLATYCLDHIADDTRMEEAELDAHHHGGHVSSAHHHGSAHHH